MIVRDSMTDPVSGRSAPTALNRACRPWAMSRPPSKPTTAAPKPITSASRTTERSTCRREAPSVRSSASSRVRCATVIENVL